MVGTRFMSYSALIAAASAQMAPGSPIEVTGELTIVFANNNTVSPPGENIPRTDAALPPTISIANEGDSSDDTAQHVILMVDLDVPRNNTRLELLHWLATNVTVAPNPPTNGPAPLAIPAEGPAAYLQPNPPQGDIEHNYIFLLFAQPDNFSVSASDFPDVMARIGFNVSQFVEDNALGGALAGNYIRVQNTSGSATASFPPARPTETGSPTSSSGAPSPSESAGGNAGAMLMPGDSLVWAGLLGMVVTGLAAFGL